MKNYKTSKLRIYNNNGHRYIYIYFKEDNHTLKINTRFEYVKNKMTVDNLYNSKIKDHERLNGHIQEMQWLVDSYINLVSGHRPINQQECMKYVKENKYHASQVPAASINKITGLSEYYDQFFTWKKNLPFLKPISLKNYQSFKNFLSDFQTYKKHKYYLFNVDEDLINEMIKFSQIDLRRIDGYISKGYLQINTLKKRLDVCKEFLIWMGDKKIATFNVHALFPKIEKTKKEIIFLNAEDIANLIAKRGDIEGEYNKMAFDAFIFDCEAGLRYEDLSNLAKDDFIKIPEGYILKKELHKGNERFKSECQNPIVDPLYIEIIEKYDFHFALKCNQIFNDTLHTLFKKHELFTEFLSVKKKYIKGNVANNDLLRNGVITCHTCRRSMITNKFIEGHTIPEVMQMSGHKNLRTLQIYADLANKELLKKNLEKKLSKIKKNSISDSSIPNQ